MGKWSNIRGKFHREGGNLGGEFRKKMKTYKFPSKNECMYEVSSKSDIGKVVKFTGNDETVLHAKMTIFETS